ncbi:single-stranded DNA-binding protein [Lacrimispora sp.]|uniref:single-stranded DNA-binding protein n=1 Tax=Lacrimispora sp. TaxID=2719234 RepID=UPI0028A7C68F|nr:single-stranded DNA-binding protein [Lacrimispora sp.]
MNNVQLVGRLTRDPEVRYSDGGATVTRFTVAVDRRFHKEGQQDADFISCVAFSKTAEFVEKWFHKGERIGLIGHIQTGSYTNQDNQKIYTTDVVADNVEFVESKGSSAGGQGGSRPEPSSAGDGFMHIPDDVGDEGLPFN